MSGTTCKRKIGFYSVDFQIRDAWVRTWNEDFSIKEEETSSRFVAIVESRRSTTWPALSL